MQNIIGIDSVARIHNFARINTPRARYLTAHSKIGTPRPMILIEMLFGHSIYVNFIYRYR